MLRRTVPVTIEIPLKFAEMLSEHGDLIIAALEDAICEARAALALEGREEREQKWARDFEKRRAQFIREGRKAHRALRRRMAALPSSVRGKSRTAVRKRVIADLAAEFGIGAEYLDFVVGKHRRELLRRVRRRRELSVLRHVIDGRSNREIAVCIGAHFNTVNKVVRTLRQQAEEAGLSLFDLERNRSGERAVATAVKTDPNVIDWAAVKAARGRP